MIEPPGLRAAWEILMSICVGFVRVGMGRSCFNVRTSEGLPRCTCVHARMVRDFGSASGDIVLIGENGVVFMMQCLTLIP